MAGRVQKWAAAMVAAGVWTGGMPSANAGGGLFATPPIEPGEVRWDGADAFGRWSVVAGARRTPGDAAIDSPLALPVDPSLRRHAIAADGASGRLAFDASRSLGAGERLDFHFGARRAALSLQDDTSEPRGGLDERTSLRALRSRLDAAFAWTRPGRWGPLSWTRTLALRMASDTRDARTAIDAGWSGVRSVLRREGAVEQNVALEGRQSFDLLRGVTLDTGLRLERHHLRTDPAQGPATFVGESFLASRMELMWRPASGLDFFARASRGTDDAGDSWLVRDPLQVGRSVAVDPSSFARTTEAGARGTFGAWQLGASAWRTQFPFALAYSASAGILSLHAPDHVGLAGTIAYRPAPSLALDAALFLDRSRALDSPPWPGAPRVFGSAGATLRMSRDWDAKLRVNYIGPREAIEDAPSLRSTTLANLEFVRWFGRTTRISLDVFNVFNQRPVAVDSFAAARAGLADGTGESFLSSPSEPRAFLLKFRTRF